MLTTLKLFFGTLAIAIPGAWYESKKHPWYKKINAMYWYIRGVFDGRFCRMKDPVFAFSGFEVRLPVPTVIHSPDVLLKLTGVPVEVPYAVAVDAANPKIIVNTGFMNLTPEEQQFLVYHETAHVVFEHYKRDQGIAEDLEADRYAVDNIGDVKTAVSAFSSWRLKIYNNLDDEYRENVDVRMYELSKMI